MEQLNPRLHFMMIYVAYIIRGAGSHLNIVNDKQFTAARYLAHHPIGPSSFRLTRSISKALIRAWGFAHAEL